MNDIFGRYPQPAFRPKEPTVLTRLDGKRPDGLTLVPWQGGKPVTWDITVVSTLAQSYLHASGHSAAGAVELAVSRKEVKYSCLPKAFMLYRARGAIALCSLCFLTELGRRLSAATGDARETAFLFQRISVALQRFNAVLVHESIVAPDVEPDL